MRRQTWPLSFFRSGTIIVDAALINAPVRAKSPTQILKDLNKQFSVKPGQEDAGFFAAILVPEKNAMFDGFKRKEIPKSLEYTVKWKMEQSNGKCDKSNLADHYNAYILTMTWLCCLQRIGTISWNGGKNEKT